MVELVAGISPAGEGQDGIAWTVLGHRYWPGFPIWIRPTRPKAAEMLAELGIPSFTRRVRQDLATWSSVRS